MESRNSDDQLPRRRFPVVNDEGHTSETSDTKFIHRWTHTRNMFLSHGYWTASWFGWLFTYALVLLCFSTSHCVALGQLVAMYSSPRDNTIDVKIAALGLGFMEDFVCATYFSCTLWLFDTFMKAASKRIARKKHNCVATGIVKKIVTFAVSWLFFFATMLPFVADLVLVVNHEMRFTFNLVTMAISEKEFVGAAPISAEEIQRGCVATTFLMIVSVLFASVRVEDKLGGPNDLESNLPGDGAYDY